ncbi:hypothetical protein [Fluviicola sp.]|uniref:hypothetical protein n=1 Tax=Fluviicola sp. TaxID=1917219 RepID=UPI003D2755AE
MKSNSILTLFALVFCSFSYAQNTNIAAPITFFITGTDTVFCSHIRYIATEKGPLRYLEYTVTDATSLPYRRTASGSVKPTNSTIVLKGRKHIPQVSTFEVSNYISDSIYIYDKVPKKAEEPLGETRYIKRRVDGKLKLYIEHDSYVGGLTSTGTIYAQTNSFCYILQLADGTFVNVDNKENMKNIIIPYLKHCEAFTQAYKGDYNIGEEGFSAMIRLYNSLCTD